MQGFKSWQSYWNFERSVRQNLRYVRTTETEDFLDCVLKSAGNRKVTLREGAIYWRAQLGHGWREEQQDNIVLEVPCAHPPKRMKPLQNRALEGRANPKGIPCLYLSTTKEAAMSEVRPWIGSSISVGQFKLLKAVEIIDCSRNYAKIPICLEEPPPEKIEEIVWSHIDRAFAEPVTVSDNTADYAATQIVAELFKRAGFGGIAYKSNFGERGYNIALFDVEAADLINCFLFQVEDISMEFSKQDNPYFMKEHYGGENKNEGDS